MVTVIKRGSDKKSIAIGMQKLVDKSAKKGFKAQEFCGILKLDEDALDIQRQLRDEWG